MDVAIWENRGFDNSDIAHLHANNKEVLAHKNKNISKVGNPIALVESKNTGNAKSMNDENFRNLFSSTYLCVGAKVGLMCNYLNIGLSNGSFRIVKKNCT